MALTAGNKMSIIGGIVTMVGQLGEAYHAYKWGQTAREQTDIDALNQWQMVERQIDGMKTDRIYNAAIERQQARAVSGNTNMQVGMSGLQSTGTIQLLKDTQKFSMERDVQERSRQTRNDIKLLKYQQAMILYTADQQKKQIKMQAQSGMQQGIIGAAGTGFGTTSNVMSSQMGGMGGGEMSFGGK